MDPVRVGVAVVQLALGLLFALTAVYTGVRVFDRFTPRVDELAEMRRGNVAVAVVLAAVVVALAIVVTPGVVGVAAAFAATGTGSAGAWAAGVGLAMGQLLVALLLGSVALRAAVWVFEQVNPGVDEQAELAKGNLAVAILLGGVLLAVASVVAIGVAAVATSLVP